MPKLAKNKVSDNTLLKKYNKERKTVAQIAREIGESQYRVKARLEDMKVYRYQKYQKKKSAKYQILLRLGASYQCLKEKKTLKSSQFD